MYDKLRSANQILNELIADDRMDSSKWRGQYDRARLELRRLEREKQKMRQDDRPSD